MSNMITATALLASAPFANALGKAIVKNACTYEVKMCNTPAQNGGYEQIDKWLQPNETYSQEYKELSTGAGWSIKLSEDENLQHNILQYEYTTHNDGIIWYDLSQVDGNPWYGNWEITAEGEGCNPKQQAYRYANDDAYGMQSCPDSSDITVTLCSGEDHNDDIASSASASVASASKANTVSWTPLGGGSSQASATSAPPSYTTGGGLLGDWGLNKAAAQPTTLATKASPTASNGDVVTVTHYETVYARETGHPHRRHAHGH